MGLACVQNMDKEWDAACFIFIKKHHKSTQKSLTGMNLIGEACLKFLIFIENNQPTRWIHEV